MVVVATAAAVVAIVVAARYFVVGVYFGSHYSTTAAREAPLLPLPYSLASGPRRGEGRGRGIESRFLWLPLLDRGRDSPMLRPRGGRGRRSRVRT